MKYNMLIVVNKPHESPAVTTQEYNSLEAATDAREALLTHSRQSTAYSLYVLVTEKGKVGL